MSGDTPDHTTVLVPASWFTPRRFAIGLVIALVAGFLPVLTGSRSFYFLDYGVLGYPFAHFHREQFWSGNIFPLWNPYSNCGAPFLAQWGTMTLYPGSLIYLLLPLPWSLGVFCLVHLFLGGLGMHRLARAWWGDDFAACVAGVGYVFGGITLSSLVWPNYCVALGWMPFVVWRVERVVREGGAARIAWAALAGAMQMLVGVPELVVFTWLIVGMLWLRGVLGREFPPLRALAQILLVGVLVAGLSAAQLLPFFELLGVSHRHAGFTVERWALPLWGVGNFVAPLFHNFITFQGVLLQNDQTFFQSVYPGILVVLLAVMGVAADRSRRAWWLVGAVLMSVVFSWGSRGVVFAWVREAFPLVSIARFPVKFLLVAAFLLPLLAAGGVVGFTRRGGNLNVRLPIWSAGVLVALLALLAWINARWPFQFDQPLANTINSAFRAAFLLAGAVVIWMIPRAANERRVGRLGIALLALVVADGLLHKPGLNPTLPAGMFRPGLAELKPPKLGEGRVMLSPVAEEVLLRSTVREPDRDFLGKRLALWSNLNLLEDAAKVTGASTLQLRWQRHVQDLLYATNAPDLGSLVDFLAVTHVTSPSNVVDWIARPSAMPLVSIGQRPVPVDSSSQGLDFPVTTFRPRDEVFILPPPAPTPLPEREPSARASLRSVSTERLEIEVQTARPAMLVIAQSFHLPWSAYVDGQPAALLRANHAFQAVALPAGAKIVTLIYEDRAFRTGAAVSLATLLACGLLIWRARRAVTSSP